MHQLLLFGIAERSLLDTHCGGCVSLNAFLCCNLIKPLMTFPGPFASRIKRKCIFLVSHKIQTIFIIVDCLKLVFRFFFLLFDNFVQRKRNADIAKALSLKDNKFIVRIFLFCEIENWIYCHGSFVCLTLNAEDDEKLNKMHHIDTYSVAICFYCTFVRCVCWI